MHDSSLESTRYYTGSHSLHDYKPTTMMVPYRDDPRRPHELACTHKNIIEYGLPQFHIYKSATELGKVNGIDLMTDLGNLIYRPRTCLTPLPCSRRPASFALLSMSRKWDKVCTYDVYIKDQALLHEVDSYLCLEDVEFAAVGW